MKLKNDNYMDGYLNNNLDLLDQAVDKNWDGVLYVCGYEGDGKTTIAEQICYRLDKTFNIDRCCFTTSQFRDAVITASKKQAVLFDESYLAFNSKNWQDKATKEIISLLTMIRKKQLFIVIVAPTFFDIQKYIAIHRSRAMIKVYSMGLERGFFEFYDRERKHSLYILGKRNEDYRVVKPSFRGRFTDWHVLDPKVYDEKKSAAINEYQKNGGNKFDKQAQYHLLAFLRSRGKLDDVRIAWLAREYFDISQQALNNSILKCESKFNKVDLNLNSVDLK